LCGILKAVLEGIVEQEMMMGPVENDRVLTENFSFPNTMALVCRRWRDIVSSAPELWTRIFCMFPEKNKQTLDFQLKKTGKTIPIDLTIVKTDPTLRGDAPLLECLQLSSYFTGIGLNCSHIRILALQGYMVPFLSHRWAKENLANIDPVTITGDKYGACLGLNMLPRWIHCLTKRNVAFFKYTGIQRVPEYHALAVELLQ